MLGTRKQIGTGACCHVTRVQLSSEGDYPVTNIDDPVRLSNEPVTVVKNLVFIVGYIRSQQHTPYRRLHCQSLVCFVDRRGEETAGNIAKSSLAILPPFPEEKEKKCSRVTQRRWRSCEPQNDNRNHHPSDLRRSTCMMQVMQAGVCCKTSGCVHV